MQRRSFVTALLGLTAQQGAQQAFAGAPPALHLHIGIERSIQLSGLSGRLQQGFAQHAGLPLQWRAESSTRSCGPLNGVRSILP